MSKKGWDDKKLRNGVNLSFTQPMKDWDIGDINYNISESVIYLGLDYGSGTIRELAPNIISPHIIKHNLKITTLHSLN